MGVGCAAYHIPHHVCASPAHPRHASYCILSAVQVIKKKIAWMDVKDAQERARTAAAEEVDKKQQLEEARKAVKGDERPAK